MATRRADGTGRARDYRRKGTKAAPRPCGNAFVTDNRVTLVPKALPAREAHDRESKKSVKRHVAISLNTFFISGSFF